MNVQRFRGGLVFKAHRLCVSLNSRLESNSQEEEVRRGSFHQKVDGPCMGMGADCGREVQDPDGGGHGAARAADTRLLADTCPCNLRILECTW